MSSFDSCSNENFLTCFIEDVILKVRPMLHMTDENIRRLIDNAVVKLRIDENFRGVTEEEWKHQKMMIVESVIDEALSCHFTSSSKTNDSQFLSNGSSDIRVVESDGKKKSLKRNRKLALENKCEKLINEPKTTKTKQKREGISSPQKTLSAYFGIMKNSPDSQQRLADLERKSNEDVSLCDKKGAYKHVDESNDKHIISILDDEENCNESHHEETEKLVESNKCLNNEIGSSKMPMVPKQLHDMNHDIKNSMSKILTKNDKSFNIQKPIDGTESNLQFGDPSFNAIQLAEIYTNTLLKSLDTKPCFPPFAHLCKALSAVCSTKKRLQKEKILTDMFLSYLYFDRNHSATKQKDGNHEELSYSKCNISISLQAVSISGNVALCGSSPLNIGHSIISQSLCEALSCSAATLKQFIISNGEMGDAAACIFRGHNNVKNITSERPSKQTRLNWNTRTRRDLEISDVIETIDKLRLLGKQGGKGVEAKKKVVLRNFFSSANNHEEIRFAVKILCNNIRTGATLITVMRCLAAAHVLQSRKIANAHHLFTGSDKSTVRLPIFAVINLEEVKDEVNETQETLRTTYAKHHDLNSCIEMLVWKGLSYMVHNCDVSTFIPVQPLLASPCTCFDDAVHHYYQHWIDCKNEQDLTNTNSPQVAAEYKYDGQRAQIHFQKTCNNSAHVKIFSRHLDEITPKFETTAGWLAECKWPDNLKTFIIDTEIVAVDRRENEGAVILPFQTLSTLKRDQSDDDPEGSLSSMNDNHQREIGLCIYAFDLLYLNGRSLLNESFLDRREKLYKNFSGMKKSGYFRFAESIDISFIEDEIHSITSKLKSFMMKSIGPGKCEGLMLKSLRSKYSSWETREKSGGHGGWRKLKKDYIDTLSDSFDVVPIGGWRGNGRKHKWISPFLLAVFNNQTGEYESLCRCMSGFSDEFYQLTYDRFNDTFLKEKPSYYRTNENPTFWFPPKEIWEIRGADLTKSPVHHAGQDFLIHESKYVGISLRFPRFIRLRCDKSIEEATSSNEVFSLFSAQSQRQT